MEVASPVFYGSLQWAFAVGYSELFPPILDSEDGVADHSRAEFVNASSATNGRLLDWWTLVHCLSAVSLVLQSRERHCYSEHLQHLLLVCSLFHRQSWIWTNGLPHVGSIYTSHPANDACQWDQSVKKNVSIKRTIQDNCHKHTIHTWSLDRKPLAMIGLRGSVDSWGCLSWHVLQREMNFSTTLLGIP